MFVFGLVCLLDLVWVYRWICCLVVDGIVGVLLVFGFGCLFCFI